MAKIMSNWKTETIENLPKFIAILIIGYLLGITFGVIFGIFLGAIPAVFYREIISSNLAATVSIAISQILGGLLGFLAMQLVNKIFPPSSKTLAGVLLGFAVGLIVIIFIEGIIYVPDPDMLIKPMHMIPISYSGIVGSYVGSIIFPFIGVIRVIRDIITKTQTQDEIKRVWSRL